MNWSDIEPVVKGGKLFVFGDTHFSAIFKGTHINYLESCYLLMQSILDKVRAASNDPKRSGTPSVVFLGDLFGVKERVVTDPQFLRALYAFFYELNQLSAGHVYSVKGNHDMGEFTTFDLFESIGLLKNPSYVDYCTSSGTLEVRLHLVNFGDERRELEMSGVADFVLGHNDYNIKGITSTYDSDSHVELVTLDNFLGVSSIISGHIHTPSETYSVLMSDGSLIQLLYLGSPARVSERVPDVWYVVFEFNPQTGNTDYDAKLMGLRPVDEEFLPESSIIDEDTARDTRNLEDISEILGTLSGMQSAEGNIISQIRKRTDFPDRAKELAIHFIEAVMV